MRQTRIERISAKDIKKRSDYQAKYERPELIIIPKDRQKTDTGFTAKGYVGNSFEIVYEILAAGAATATFLHPKKDKVIRVLSGTGLFHTEENDYVKVLAGEDITVQAGTKHRLTAETDLYLMIIQQSKYQAHLEVDTSTVVKVDMDNRIEDVPSAPVIPVFNRGPSKAAQQLLEAAERRRGPITTAAPAERAAEPGKPTAQFLGPMPNFGEDLIGEPG